MTETKEQRKQRILKEREERRKQKNPTQRRWIILKQNLQTKYYEIIQNTKNSINKLFSEQFWKQVKQDIDYHIKWYGNVLKDINKELILIQKTIFNIEYKKNIQSRLNIWIGNPELDKQKRLNNYLMKILFQYNQTLVNEEWLARALFDNRTDLTRSKLREVSKSIIENAKFNSTDRTTSVYDLLLTVNKERTLRKIRESDWMSFGSPDFTVSEEAMRKAEFEVDSNLKKWRDLLKVFE